jgi:hypothetical protein
MARPNASTAGDIVTAALAAAEKSGGGASVEVSELVSQEVFDENCSGKRICIIAFLKDILDECVGVDLLALCTPLVDQAPCEHAS